jgi:hypothetical protein
MRLKDFEAQLTPVVFDPSVLDHNAKKAASQVSWKDTKLSYTEAGRYGLQHCYLADAIAARGHNLNTPPEESDPNYALHEPAAVENDEAEVNEKPGPKVGVKYKGSESEEPEELDPDGEEEAEDTDEESAMDSVKEFIRVLVASDANLADDIHGLLASVMRDKNRQRVDGRIVSGHKNKVSHSSGYITDAAMVEKYLPANELCVAAENRLRDRVVQEQADNANRSYWSGLFYLLRSQPEGSRIRDIKNKVCLSTLISKTLAA